MTATDGERKYKSERDDQIRAGGRKQILTASRTICPDWQAGEAMGVKLVGREVLWMTMR